MPPTVRGATRQDVPRIVELLADDPLGATREQATDPLPVEYWHAFEEISTDLNNELLVLVDEDGVQGCLQLTYVPGLSRRGALRAQLESIRVARDRRGRGFGQLLVQAAIDRARDRGCRLVQLTSDKSRPRAHEFYVDLGFVATHEGLKREL